MNPVELQLPYDHSEQELVDAYAKAAGISSDRASQYAILRKSIDARKKNDIRIVYQVVEKTACPELVGISALIQSVRKPSQKQNMERVSTPRIVVAGAGPAGLFAALYLALAGYRPLLIERGQPVEQRLLDVARFWNSGVLDPESNVQFGEGGAGTFSDGKLTTGIRDPRCRAILEEFVLLGAPAEILYLTKPHVGTDRLRAVVRALRSKIQQNGGDIRFGTRLKGLVTTADGPGGSSRLNSVVLEWQGTSLSDNACRTEEVPVSALLLAVGHSARDTFQMLQQNGVTMAQKPFAVGLRIEHHQSLINHAQYGAAAGHPNLPPADYKLSCQLPDGRSVYTFCMCPGGQVIASASAAGEVVTNGMSHYQRDGENANSALLVPVTPGDFASDDPLAGIRFQLTIERRAFCAGGSTFRAPAQTVGAFLKSGKSTGSAAVTGIAKVAGTAVNPTYTNKIMHTDLSTVLPSFIADSIRESLPLLAHKIHEFADPGAILTGVETRSSSPVRILRDPAGQSSLQGLYPCGEGAGYAGGIMSAAVDGLRCAEAVRAARRDGPDE